MNRKNTILLAVLINGALLVVLFITALTSQEEISLAPTHELSMAPTLYSQDAPPPLFVEELDLAQRLPPKPSNPLASNSLPQVLPDSVQVEMPKQAAAPIVHSLPPVAVEPAPVAPVASGEPLYQEVTVKKGDTLEKIARANRTTVDEITRINRLPNSFLRVGQVLKLSPSAPKAAVSQAAPHDLGPEYYTVKVGDNPWTIAMKHHLKVEELLKLNALNEEKARRLKPGDRLKIR